MRYIFTLFLLYFLLSIANGQDVYAVLNGPSLRATISSDGQFFSGKPQFQGLSMTDYNGEATDLGILFWEGLWIAAKRPNEIYTRVSRSYYNEGDFIAGPFNYDGGINLNRVWIVTKKQINDHIADFADGTVDNVPPENILEWPGFGNSQLGVDFPQRDFAAFYDQNNDGIYDAYAGDYPIINKNLQNIRPFELAYTVFHDPNNTYNVGVEIHAIMYSLQSEDNPLFDRTIFTSHRIVNLGEGYDEFYIGNWQDSGSGWGNDEYLGCDPIRNANYTYNSDKYDWDYSNDPWNGFKDNPVVHSSKFLNQEMSSFTINQRQGAGDFPPGTWDPETRTGIENILKGKWRDGIPMTYGGTGYDPNSTEIVNFLYPDYPSETEGWSMLSTQFPFSDSRTIASAHTGSLASGESITLDMVQLVTMDENYDHIEKIALNLEELDSIQAAYDSQFDDLFRDNDSQDNFNEDVVNIRIFPNPSTQNLTIEQKLNIDHFKIFDITGAEVQKGEVHEEISSVELRLNKGVYWIKCSSGDKEFAAQKFVVIQR